MKCLIVGGGIAGLCLAKALRDIDVEVQLVELKSVWTVYGVGIIQQANVVRAMSQLGLLDEYLRVAFPFEEVRLFDSEGHPKATIPLERLAGPEYPASLGVSRLALHTVLHEAALKRGAQFRTGLSVTSFKNLEDRVEVTFSDGEQDSFDLVIGADGANSHVRTLLLGKQIKPTPTGQAVWRYNFARPKDLNYLGMYYGPRGNAGVVPLAENLLYLFVTTTEPEGVRIPPQDLHTVMRERLSDFGGLIAELREQITDPAGVVYRPLESVFSPIWYEGRVLLIGDAAHTTTPHLGQGAGMAIEDTVVLRDELANKRPIAKQLAAFVARRYERCKYITELSVQVGAWEIGNTHPGERMAAIRDVQVYTAAPI